MVERLWSSREGAPARARPIVTWRGGLGVLLVVLLTFGALQGWLVVTVAGAILTRAHVVDIPPRLGLVGVAQRLEEAGVIRSPLGFVILAAIRGHARSLKAGEYEIPQGANTIAVLRLLESGRVVHHPVLLREGGTVAELAKALGAERLAMPDDIVRTARDPVFLRSVGIEGNSVEGYLFPDTYQLVKGMTAEEILGRMVARMRQQLTPETIDRARARDLTVHQLLTLASIIEREAVGEKEMGLISAVFWNRLKRDIPLQADPTVQYAVGKEGLALTRADLEVESPFNTYRHVGLPPGPIASPSRAAIEAAAQPAEVDYLYFVARNEREHRFSTSLAEHNAAVARYRSGKGR